MDLSDRCLHLCEHIETLTGVHTALLDLTTKSFAREPYHHTCALQSTCCTAYLTPPVRRLRGGTVGRQIHLLLPARAGVRRHAAASVGLGHGILHHHRAVYHVQRRRGSV